MQEKGAFDEPKVLSTGVPRETRQDFEPLCPSFQGDQPAGDDKTHPRFPQCVPMVPKECTPISICSRPPRSITFMANGEGR